MSLNVAVVGGETLAGEMLLERIGEAGLDIATLGLFSADDDQIGTRHNLMGGTHRVRHLDDFTAENEWTLTFLADEELSLEALQTVIESGTRIIDLYPRRFGDRVRYVVPQINGERALEQISSDTVLGCPMAAVTTAALALESVHRQDQLLRLNMTVLQSAAELGRKGVEALASETARLLNGRDPETGFLPAQFAFNLLPQVGEVDKEGHALVERLVMKQLSELFDDEEIEIVVNVLQLPIFYGLAVILQAETQQQVDLETLRDDMQKQQHLRVADSSQIYTPVGEAVGNDNIHICRMRHEAGSEESLGLCAMTDNLRRGLAVNALDIAVSWVKGL